MINNLMLKIEEMNPWHFLWIGIIFSELFTIVLTSILSYLWWGYISPDVLLIGSIDAFIVALLVIIIVIYFVNMIKEKSIANRLLNQEVKNLRGIIPICMHCKGIRDDKGYWNRVERYIGNHANVSFSHGICPSCFKEHHPELAE